MYIQIACWTERKNRDQKAAMFMEKHGRKIANMTITVELEHVKALFNFLYLSPIQKVFACGYLKKLILMYK